MWEVCVLYKPNIKTKGNPKLPSHTQSSLHINMPTIRSVHLDNETSQLISTVSTVKRISNRSNHDLELYASGSQSVSPYSLRFLYLSSCNL